MQDEGQKHGLPNMEAIRKLEKNLDETLAGKKEELNDLRKKLNARARQALNASALGPQKSSSSTAPADPPSPKRQKVQRLREGAHKMGTWDYELAQAQGARDDFKDEQEKAAKRRKKAVEDLRRSHMDDYHHRRSQLQERKIEAAIRAKKEREEVEEKEKHDQQVADGLIDEEGNHIPAAKRAEAR